MSQAKLNKTYFQLQFKSGLEADINSTTTKNLAVEGEPHWTTDSDVLYVFDGTQNIPVGSKPPFVTKSAIYTLTQSDYRIEVDTSGATQTLPTAVGIKGREYEIINASSGTVRVDTTSSQTIGNKPSGNPTYVDLAPEEVLKVVSNNTNWRII